MMIELQKKDSYEDIIKQLCNILPLLFEELKLVIFVWLSTIPRLGPTIAFDVQNMKLITFDNFISIYNGFPNEAKKLFQNPDFLHNIIESLEVYITKILNLIKKTTNSKKVNIGGGLTKYIVKNLVPL